MGLTSLEEVLRVIQLKNMSSTLCQNCKRKLPPSSPFCPFCAWERRASDRKTGSFAKTTGRNLASDPRAGS